MCYNKVSVENEIILSKLQLSKLEDLQGIALKFVLDHLKQTSVLFLVSLRVCLCFCLRCLAQESWCSLYRVSK